MRDAVEVRRAVAVDVDAGLQRAHEREVLRRRWAVGPAWLCSRFGRGARRGSQSPIDVVAVLVAAEAGRGERHRRAVGAPHRHRRARPAAAADTR